MINIQKNGRSFAINFMCIALFFLLVLIPISTKAEIIIERPDSFVCAECTDTDRPGDAIDTNLSSYFVIRAVPNADPYITYSWDSNINYDPVFLNIRVYSNNFTNDKWGIKYSLDGVNWIILKEMSSENIVSRLDIRENIGPASNLKIKIDTDTKGKVDGGIVNIYDIFAEATTSGPAEPILSQSSYRFFKNVESVDLSAIANTVPGDDRAKVVAVYGGSAYIAGFDPNGWRIEMRDIIDGHLLQPATTFSSLGEPNAMTVDSVGGFLYIVGDHYLEVEGSWAWMIQKRRLSDLGLEQVAFSDPSDEYDSAYAVTVANDSSGCVVLIAGSDRSHGGTDAQWRIEKRSCYNDMPLIDVAVKNPSEDHDIPLTIAVNDGDLYVAGYDRNERVEPTKPGKKRQTSSNAQWRIERRSIGDLSLLGEVTNNPTDNFDTVKDIAIDTNNDFIILVGSQEYGLFDTAWRIEKMDRFSLSRILFSNSDISDGNCWVEREEGVDEGPAIICDFGYDDQPEAIAIDDTHMYIAGYIAPIGEGGDTAWHIQKRDIVTGSQDSFPSYPITQNISDGNNDRAYAIDVYDANIYVAGYYNPSLPEWRMEIRDKYDGSLTLLTPLSFDHSTPLDIASGEEFRLRMLMHVELNPLPENGQHFKLQFEHPADVWTDVGVSPTSIPIVFNDNPSISDDQPILDGSPLLVNVKDPEHLGHTTRAQTYEADRGSTNNGFTNSISSIGIDEDGMWDFSLILNNASSDTYRFRIVIDDGTPDGTPLDYYDLYPEITVSEPGP